MESDNEPKDIADLVDVVWAETEADFIRHYQARVFFMNRLVQQLRKEKTFLAWSINSGMFVPASQLRGAISHLQTLQRQSAPVGILRVAQATGKAHDKTFIDTLRLHGNPIVTNTIDRYVQEELKLQWDWLRVELYRAWLTDLVGWIVNKPQKLIYQPISRQESASQVEYHFQTRTGESFPDMLARFKEETERFWKEKSNEYNRLFPKGTRRKDQDIEKYVEWFFRLEVLKERVKHISEYDADGKKRPWSQERKDIRTYAKVAKEWLSLGFSQENLKRSGLVSSEDDELSHGEVE